MAGAFDWTVAAPTDAGKRRDSGGSAVRLVMAAGEQTDCRNGQTAALVASREEGERAWGVVRRPSARTTEPVDERLAVASLLEAQRELTYSAARLQSTSEMRLPSKQGNHGQASAPPAFAPSSSFETPQCLPSSHGVVGHVQPEPAPANRAAACQPISRADGGRG